MSAQRMLFLTVAALLGAGILLSGYRNVHWLLYAVPLLLTFAGVTGICPALLLYRKVGFK